MSNLPSFTITSIVGWGFSATKAKQGKPSEPFTRIDFMHNGQKVNTRIWGTPEETAPVLAELGISVTLPQPITILESVSNTINPKTQQPYVNYYTKSQAGFELSQRKKAQREQQAPPQFPTQQQNNMAGAGQAPPPSYTPQSAGPQPVAQQAPPAPVQQDMFPPSDADSIPY